MPERLPDHDPRKWVYQEHTLAKHRILARYLSGWITILTRAGMGARQQRVRLMLVDGFAGRGRYSGGEVGSPLVIASIANQAVDYLKAPPGSIEFDCAFIEADTDNHQVLMQEIEAARARARPGVTLRDPVRQEFVDAVRPLLAEAQRCNGLFLFADPFGFGDIPLDAMRDILAVPHGEVFITFMVQYVNRFFDDTGRDRAFASLLGITPAGVAAVRQQLRGAADRELRLRDYYMERLKAGAGATYTWAFRMVPEQSDTALYYLIHASTHPKALRVMKSTMKRYGTQGEYAFYGRSDFARKQQLLLLAPDDPNALKEYLLKSRADTTIEYEILLSELCDDPACYYYVDQDIHDALGQLRDAGLIAVTPVTSKTARGLQGFDRIQFPAYPPASPPASPPSNPDDRPQVPAAVQLRLL